MGLVYKWLKSPLLKSCTAALILLSCAWYAYVLFYDMSRESAGTSFYARTHIKHLQFDEKVQSLTAEIVRIKAQLETLTGDQNPRIESILNLANKEHKLLNYFWLSERNNKIELTLSDQLNGISLFKFQDNETGRLEERDFIPVSFYSTFLAENISIIGFQFPINNAGYFLATIDVSSMIEEDGFLNLDEEGFCLRLSSYSMTGSTRFLYASSKGSTQCQQDVEVLEQDSLKVEWFNQSLILSFNNSKSTFSDKWLSLTNVFAILFVLMSCLIVFYIYRSRHYESKIESLLSDKGQSLEKVRTEYSKLFMLSVDGIYRASLKGNLLKANPAYASAFGYENEDEFCAKINDIGGQLHLDPDVYLHFIKMLKKEQRVIAFEWQSQDLAGRPIWLLENAYLTRQESGEVYYEGFIANITEKKKAEIALKKQAQMDSLTGLLNRATFVNQMSSYIASNSASKSAIFFIDLDKFKTVNDQYGHHVGDELLVEFSRRLQACFSSGEMISRLGGDEFSVFLKSVKSLPQLHELADKVVAGLRKPFAFSNGCNFKISASIGISMLDESVKSASEGLKQADMAMYEVKRNGRADFIIFNQGLNESERRRSLLEKYLFSALKLNEIHINYQPIVCFKSAEVKGMEALMRWRNASLGDVSPVEFVPIAEQINQINPFSNWLVHHVCHDLKGLIEVSGNDNLFVSINISPKQLLSDQVCDNLLMSLEVNQLKPKNIKLEITETAIYDQEESVVRQLRRIRSYGIAIYIDDFGTGYSSLERLIQYPFDGLKIDRSFVKDLVPGNSRDVILKASVKMAEMLNLVVVVEGIESHFQYDFFKALECEYAQGFLLYKPLPINELNKLILQQSSKRLIALTDKVIS